MKQLKNLLPLLAFAIVIDAAAQIPNPSFEDSAYAKYNVRPISWNTPNTVFSDLSDPANSYLQLYNDDDGSNPINFISDESTLNFDAARGFEINGRPDSLAFWMTYTIPTGDTLIIRTKNRETQNPFGYGELRLTGSQTEMTRYALKINYPAPGFADSGVIQAYFTDNTQDWQEVSFESFEFLNFIGQPLNVIPNSKFNVWEQDSIIQPLGWTSINYAAKVDGFEYPEGTSILTSDASNGNRAIVLENKDWDGDIAFGLFAAINPERFFDYDGDIDDPTPMFPVSKKYASLIGDYKLSSSLQDTGLLSVAMFAQGNMIAKRDLMLTNTAGNDYVSFEAHMDYDTFTSIPDSASIFILSVLDDEGVEGTKLYIDNLSFMETSSVKKIAANDLVVYPNPATESLSISLKGQEIEGVRLLNVEGKTLKQFNLNSYENIDVSGFAAGTYIISIKTSTHTYHQKITIK